MTREERLLSQVGKLMHTDEDSYNHNNNNTNLKSTQDVSMDGSDPPNTRRLQDNESLVATAASVAEQD